MKHSPNSLTAPLNPSSHSHSHSSNNVTHAHAHSHSHSHAHHNGGHRDHSNNTSPPIRHTRSILLLGPPLVGKTAICTRLTVDRFDDAYEPTYETSYNKPITHKSHDVLIALTDTSGLSSAEQFRSEYGVGYHAYIFVFAITSIRSLDTLRVIHDKFSALLGTNNIPQILVGTKADVAESRQITQTTALALAAEWNCHYIECSAKTNHNIERIFTTVLDDIDRVNYHESSTSYIRLWSFVECLQAILIQSCCLADSSTDTLTDNWLKWERTVNFVMGMTLTLGLVILTLSIYIGLQTSSDTIEIFAYIIFSIGFLLSLISTIGCVGMKNNSTEYLRVYTVTLFLLTVTQLIVYTISVTSSSLINQYIMIISIIIAIIVIIQLASVGIVYSYLSLLQQSANINYSSAATHHNNITTNNNANGSINNTNYQSLYE